MHKLLPWFAMFWLSLPTVASADPATLQIGVDVTSGTDVRHYQIKLLDDHCGRASQKSRVAEDELKVCAHVDGASVRLDIEWKTRQGDRETHVETSAMLAHGAHVDLDINTAKLVVALT